MKIKKTVKIIVGGFIVLFVIALVLGITRYVSHESPHVKPTEAQLTMVKETVVNDLLKQGKNASAYELEILPKFRTEKEENTTILIAQVSAEKVSDAHVYLINVNSNTILMHSQTEFYNGFLGKRKGKFEHFASERDEEGDKEKRETEKTELPN